VNIVQLVDRVERELAEFYAFAPAARASGHLVTKAELHRSLGDPVKEKPEWHARAGVWLSEPSHDEDVFIGLHLDDALKAQLESHDPTVALDAANLDAFCVLVEEVSHFHLILNRALATHPVTRLELEWQGEVDKLVVASRTLERQSGDPHVLPLARALYDLSSIDAHADAELYWQATKYAARFWFDALRAGLESPEDARPTLRAAYEAQWDSKQTTWKKSA